MNDQVEAVTPSADAAGLLGKRALLGVWAPSLTPVKADFSIDCKTLLSHVNWLLRNGCHGVALFGTTGEAPSFNADERIEALEFLLDKGVNPERLMIGNGFCAPTDTIRVTRHAVDSGCKTLLMIPPFYFKNLSDEGVGASYRHVFDKVNDPDLRVVMYHFPKLSMVPISHNLIESLVRSHGSLIAGLKDSSGEWSSVESYINAFPKLSIFPGSDVFLLRGLKIGGAGTITATANINPDGIRLVFDRWAEASNAEEQQSASEIIRGIISQFPLAPALKAVHAHFQSDGLRRVRPPLVALSKDERTSLIMALNDAGFVLAKR